MEPKFIEKDSFPIIGIELKTTTHKGKNFKAIPEFWNKILKQGLIHHIPNREDPDTVLGICMDFHQDENFSYIIGAEVTNTEEIPAGMVAKVIPAAQYAIFTAVGRIPDSIQKTVKYIYKEWLPQSAYQRRNSADFELYDERCRKGENAEVDIYIPIIS